MDNITSLNGLIQALKETEAENYVAITKSMQIPLSDFDKYAHWKEDGYARNCICKNENFELMLICWKGGDCTPIHGHDNQKCWVYSLEGEMTEYRFQKNEDGSLSQSNQMTLLPGKISYMEDTMGLHSLKNHPSKKSMTLHLYMKPIESCEIYNEDKKCFEDKSMNFDTIDGTAITQ